MTSMPEALVLGHICSKIGSGATPKGGKEVYLASGPYALIRSQNVLNDGFSNNGLAYISERQAKALDGVTVEPGDVLLNITGDSVARVCQAPKSALPARVNQHVAIIRPRPDVLDPSFLRYFLVSPEQQTLLLTLASSGATRNALTKGMIKQIEVPAVLIEEQKQIARILGSLDDHIDHNQALAANLEAIARRLFKSWFVDFDPVRAKAAGEKPSGLADDIALLFPDRFVESELGEIPEGWRVETVGDLSDVVGGTTPRTKEPTYWNGGIHAWATPKDLSALLAPILLDTERQITDAGLSQISSGLLPKGTVLLSSRAPIGYLAIAEVPVSINQGFIAMKPKTGISNIFLLLWASVAREEIVSRANGSTFLEISKANFRPIPLIKPTAEVMQEFDQLARPLYEKVANCMRESRTLSQVRDLLLPRLISGKIRVSDAQAQIEESLA